MSRAGPGRSRERAALPSPPLPSLPFLFRELERNQIEDAHSKNKQFVVHNLVTSRAKEIKVLTNLRHASPGRRRRGLHPHSKAPVRTDRHLRSEREKRTCPTTVEVADMAEATGAAEGADMQAEGADMAAAMAVPKEVDTAGDMALAEATA
jgi:hypothetical protein